MRHMKKSQMINFKNIPAISLTVFLSSAGIGLAQNGGGVFAPGGHDSSQPVEISSDSLEVEQEKQLAVLVDINHAELPLSV